MNVAPSVSPVGLFDGRDHPRLYDHTVRVFRGRHYSTRTQKAYMNWIARFLRFHAGRHPRTLREEDECYLDRVRACAVCRSRSYTEGTSV